jgi:diaminopimelate epimerase
MSEAHDITGPRGSRRPRAVDLPGHAIGTRIAGVTLAFEKIEGLGNDFVVVERAEPMDVAEARPLCDRHRGIGADGVLSAALEPPAMRVVNADGSRPEMCGNGVRCVVLWLARRGRVAVGQTIAIDTDAGPHACTLLSLDDAQTEARVRVAMRAYDTTPGPAFVSTRAPLIEGELRAGDRVLRGTAVSMGNPHLVIFDAERQGAVALAPALEHHPLFPARVNVGLAEQTGPRAIGLRVFERGVGFTEACGTGACAAAAAAVETGRMPRGEPIAVTLPGGTLEIVVGERGAPVLMTGPARFVFAGRVG